MLTHNSENEVTCEFCGKKYANRKKYRSHKERIHSQKVIECEKCPLTFTRKQHHEAHLVKNLFIKNDLNFFDISAIWITRRQSTNPNYLKNAKSEHLIG